MSSQSHVNNFANTGWPKKNGTAYNVPPVDKLHNTNDWYQWMPPSYRLP